MVLTTVPQTALPVQAEEATEASLDTASEGTEEATPGSDEAKESEETTETKEPADGKGESNEGSSEVTTPADGENENEEDEAGDNSDNSITPDIENPGEDQDTENPDEEVTEPVVNPVEEPAEEEPVEEGTSTVDSEDATVMAATTFGIEFKISVDGTELKEPTLDDYVTDITNVDADNKVDGTNDVTFKVTPASAQLELDGAPTATIAGTNATVSEASGVYTITDSHAATGDVVVTINLVTKYTVGAPDVDADAQVTWQIKTTASDAAYGSSVSVKKGESVVLQATLAANADNVTITVPGATTEKQTLTAAAEAVTAEFTVAMTEERIAALVDGKLTATYEVTKADAEVAITGKKPVAAEGVDDVAAVFGTDFKAQYRVKTTGAEDFAAWADVPSTGIIAAKKDDVVQLKFAPGAKFSVSGVKFAGSTITAKNDVEGEDEDVYEVNVAAPANPVATENTVEVTLAAANQITLKAATDAQIASVQWSADDGSNWNRARKTADGWVADTKAAAVTFKVAAKIHNKVSYINNDTKGTHDAAAETCENCLTLSTSDHNKTVTTTAVDASGANDITLTIATEQIKHDYTLTAAEGLTVTITKAGASTPESSKGTTDADKNKYALLEGETYFVAVKQGEDVVALEKLETATANNATMDYDSDANAFTFEVDAVTEEANRTIVIELKERENKTVSLVMADAQLSAASVKADAHKKLNDTTKAEEDVAADPTAIALSTTEKEYTVAEGGKFTFTLSVADEAYTVSKVETSTDSGATWSGLEKGTDDKYTLAEVNEDISIRVTTELDQTKAHSVIFTPDANVKEVLINGSPVKSGEKKYVKVAAGANVAFTVTPNAGFTVDKVKFGTGETDDVPVSAGTYTYTFPAARTDATITISTKAAELTEDRYVKFVMPDDENVKLNVTTAGVKTEKDGNGDDVYVMTMKKTEPATEEVPELTFDLVVKNGYTIKPQLASIVDATNETVRMTADSRKKNDDGDWVYSFKVVAAALQAANLGTKEAPRTITVTAPIEEKVTLSLKANSLPVKYKNLSQSGSNFTTWAVGNSKTASEKDTIVLQVADGQSLSVGGKDVTEELDDYGNYSFVAALDATKDNDTNIEIDVKNSAAAEYELKYGTAEGTYPDTVGKDVVAAKLGDKIYVQLNKTTAPAGAEAITGVVLSEGAKSTAVANKNQDEAANKGKAVITVADADFTVTFKAIKTERTANGFTKKTVVNAATIHINAKDADGMNLTAKGISDGKTIKIDATKQMTYPLTLKETKTSRNVLDVKKYIADGAIVAEETGNKGLVTVFLDEETGSLVITGVKDKDGEAKAVSEITIKAKGAAADAKPLLTFKVEVTTPELTVKSLNSPNQGMHDVLVDVTGDPKIGTVAEEFDMYYEIEVKHTAGESAVKKDGFYYLNALDENGNVVPVSQLIKVNADTDKTKFENTYTINARLVAVAAGAVVPTGDPLQGEAKAKIADALVKYGSAKVVEKKNIKTRSDYYEDKLNVTKKTTKLYTGQSNVLVAIPKFSAKAGHIEDIRAVVYNTDGSLASGVSARVDESGNTMEVRVSAGDDAAPGKGTAKYNVVIYATATMNADNAAVDPGEYNMYRASAKVPITVQKGIHSITVAGNPGKIAIVPDKNGKTKNVSFSLKPTGWYDYHYDVKAQTQKFDYSNEIVYGNSKNAGKVTVKNGKVTVDKDFYVSNDPAQNTFTLTVKANDWTGNETVSSPVTVEVTNKAMTISSVRLVDSNNKPYGATITTTDLFSADLEILDENGKSIEPSFVTLTPNKGKLYVDESGELNFEGYQKNLTITAVAKDGKKAKKSSIKYTINYAKADAYTLDVNSVNNSFKQLSDTSWEYVGRGNETISFDVKAIANDRGYTAENPDSAWTKEYNYSVKITGGKNTSSKTDVAKGEYEVTPTAGKVTVTVTDKAAKKSYPFTIEDKGWVTAAAPKATTKDKLFMAKDPSIDAGYNYAKRVAQDMTYTIKNCKYNAVKFTHVGGSYSGIDNLEGVHVIDGDTLLLKKLVPNYPTTEKYSVVYGDRDENGFWPKTKATTISIKVNKVGNIKAVNKYTISTNLGYGVKLDAKPIPTSVTLNDVVEFNSIEAANEKGQPNKFYDYFELVNGAGDADGPKDTIQLKTAYRTEAGLAELYALKKGVAGYVTYTVYNPNGYEVKKQDKITVVVNDTGKPKTTATDINIVGLSGASGLTTVKIGNTSVDVLKAVTDSTDWKVAVPTAADIEAGATGNVKLTANGEPKSGNVNVYILPVGSKYAASTPDADVITNGIKATVKVNVKAVDDTKSSKITFLSKNAKTPEAVIAGTKVNLSTTFTLDKDYKYTLTNAKIASVAKVPEAREAEIKGAPSKTASKAILATNGVTLNADKTAVTIVMDRDAEGLATNGKTTYKVPVLVTFDAGAEEIVYFSIKPEKVPSVDEVKADVEAALKGFAVAEAAYNNGVSAASTVQEAARKLGNKVPALSGVDVAKITAAAKPDTDTEKFADTGTAGSEGFKAGHHTVIVTLDDETKKGTEGYTAATCEVVVTKAAAPVSLGASLEEAINVYLLPNQTTGADPTDKKPVPTTMTKWTLQTELQTAADKAEPGKYIVRVTDFDLDTAEVTVPAASGTNAVNAEEGTKKTIVSGLTFKYTVMVAKTGKYLAEDGSEKDVAVKFAVTMGATTNQVGKPGEPTPPVVDPDPEEPESFEVTISGVSASTVTYAVAEANDETVPNSFNAVAGNKVSVESGKKLYLKVEYSVGTVTVKKGDDTTLSAVDGNPGVYLVGMITGATAVTIAETASTTPTEPES